MSWAQEEFKTIDLSDTRLNARAVLLAQRLAACPGHSIPNACKGRAETQAAYRFLSNKRTDWEAVMRPHWEVTQLYGGEFLGARLFCHDGGFG